MDQFAVKAASLIKQHGSDVAFSVVTSRICDCSEYGQEADRRTWMQILVTLDEWNRSERLADESLH